MISQNPNMPDWQKGLIKRKWIYLLVIFTVLVLLGDWYLKRLDIARNKEKPTFEELEVQINKRDAILTTAWRGIWARLPAGIQSNFSDWKPSPSADQLRLAACGSLSGHGKKALPLVLEKLNDSDHRMRHAALQTLYFLKISNQQTWNSISQIILNQRNTMSIRRQAFLVLIGLHWQEPRFSNFLDTLVELNLDLVKSMNTIAVYSPLSSSSVLGGAVSPESELLSFMMLGFSDPFFSMMFDKKHPIFSEIALRFMRGNLINAQPFQSKIAKFLDAKDDFTRESAFLGLLRLKNRNENWKDDPTYFLMAAEDSSPKIQKLAVRFLAPHQEISPNIQNTLFEMISSKNQEIALSALGCLMRCKVQATAHQLKVVEELATNGDPLRQRLANEFLEQILRTPVR